MGVHVPELFVYVYECKHVPTYQNHSFCPGQQSAAWAVEDALSCVLGGTGAEKMSLGPSPPGLIGQSCSTC